MRLMLAAFCKYPTAPAYMLMSVNYRILRLEQDPMEVQGLFTVMIG